MTHYAFKKVILLNLFCLVMFPGYINAKSSDKDELEVSLRVKNFSYKEISSNNQVLNKEDGPVPGLGMIYYEQYGNVQMQLEAALYDGVVDYTGQTQGGSPITTRSDTTFAELNFFVTRWMNQQSDLKLGIYAGLGYNYWKRNIRSTTTTLGAPVSGLLEKYLIGYGSIGAKIKYLTSERSTLSLDLRASKILKADVDVDFLGTGGFDNASLSIGKKQGYRVALPWEKKLSHNSSIVISPYYEFWEFGLSNTKELTINGSPSGTNVFEPESETSNYGVNFSFRQDF